MSSFSVFLAEEILDHVFRGNSYTRGYPMYVGLFTADTGLDANTIGSAAEVAAGDYVRFTVDGTTYSFTAPTGTPRTISNNIEWAWSQATNNWGDITHTAILDSATLGAGNILAWGGLTVSPKTVNNGDTARFLAGEFDVSLT